MKNNKRIKIINKGFYSRDTVVVAKELLGKILVRKIGDCIVSGIITGTEAYRYTDDPASHSFKGMTERNKPMFGEVGRAYVYFTYGMHYCMNIVAKDVNFEAGAVLIRSLKPCEGIDLMIKERKTDKIINLTNGPAKLTQALKITKAQCGEDVTRESPLFVTQGISVANSIISKNSRIGITHGRDKLWNFSIQI